MTTGHARQHSSSSHVAHVFPRGARRGTRPTINPTRVAVGVDRETAGEHSLSLWRAGLVCASFRPRVVLCHRTLRLETVVLRRRSVTIPRTPRARLRLAQRPGQKAEFICTDFFPPAVSYGFDDPASCSMKVLLGRVPRATS